MGPSCKTWKGACGLLKKLLEVAHLLLQHPVCAALAFPVPRCSARVFHSWQHWYSVFISCSSYCSPKYVCWIQNWKLSDASFWADVLFYKQIVTVSDYSSKCIMCRCILNDLLSRPCSVLVLEGAMKAKYKLSSKKNPFCHNNNTNWIANFKQMI